MRLTTVLGKPAVADSASVGLIKPTALVIVVAAAAILSSLSTAYFLTTPFWPADPTPAARLVEVPSQTATEIREGVVTQVVHGDTLLLDGTTRVRLIGVDTLSPADPRPDVAACGEASRNFVAALVENERVRLEYEGVRTDDFGRLRAHVYLLDGRLLSAEIVKAGYAIARGKLASRYDPFLRSLDANARLEKVGLWREEPAEIDTSAASASAPTQPLPNERASAPDIPSTRYTYESPPPVRTAAATDVRGYVPYVPPPAPIHRDVSSSSSYSAPVRPVTSARPAVAENGSYYGEISTATGRPKTVHVSGYTRRDGTYVRGHYRSRP